MNESRLLSIPVSSSLGEVSAILTMPEEAHCLLALAHGAGAGMKHPFMESLALALSEEGVGCLRYNFPYMENKKHRPDPPAIAEKTVASVISKAHELSPGVPVFAGGKSFGGRMTSQLLAKESGQVRGIVFYGFPLHPPGKPSTLRADHLRDVKIPMLFLQGTRDNLAALDLVEQVCSALSNATLITFEGADHSFKVPKKALIPELARRTSAWMRKIPR